MSSARVAPWASRSGISKEVRGVEIASNSANIFLTDICEPMV
jgi:hypothetical protein